MLTVSPRPPMISSPTLACMLVVLPIHIRLRKALFHFVLFPSAQRQINRATGYVCNIKTYIAVFCCHFMDSLYSWKRLMIYSHLTLPLCVCMRRRNISLFKKKKQQRKQQHTPGVKQFYSYSCLLLCFFMGRKRRE